MTVWTVPATIVRVVDADTLDALLDLGWHVTYHAKIRLAGINAPEMRSPEGQAAREYVRHLLAPDPAMSPAPVTVVSHSLDKYGRVLADVYLPDTSIAGVTLPVTSGRHLNRMLLDAGHAVVMK